MTYTFIQHLIFRNTYRGTMYSLVVWWKVDECLTGFSFNFTTKTSLPFTYPNKDTSHILSPSLTVSPSFLHSKNTYSFPYPKIFQSLQLNLITGVWLQGLIVTVRWTFAIFTFKSSGRGVEDLIFETPSGSFGKCIKTTSVFKLLMT